MARGFALAFALAALLTATLGAKSQTALSIRSVTSLYVESFGTGDQPEQLRRSLVDRLRKSGKYRVVDSAAKADATLRGNGQIWVKGHFAINTRAPAATRQPVYAGFLSVEVIGKDGEPLWSYLVTPSKFAWSNVADDLANNLTRQMLLAREAASLPGPATAVRQTLAQTSLTGAGATFPAPLYRLWFQSFQQLHPEVRIAYDAVGSDSGMRMLAANKVDFAASDLPSLREPPAGAPRGRYLRIASVVGAIVPTYHLEGLTRDLRFTADTLAGIYLGDITRWNDPRLEKLNKDVDLPDAPIVVIHRSDGSGTTYAWSDFLSRTNPAWKNKVGVGSSLPWPVGMGADGNEGVAIAVQTTPNSIAYVELVYAIQHQLSFGSVRNRSGMDVRASLDSVAAAATASMMPPSDAFPSIIDPPGKQAYPIAGFTWLLVPENVDHPAKKSAMVELIQWILTSGQKECSALGYTPLPAELAAQQWKVLRRLK